VGCRQRAPKIDLIRFVRTEDGVLADPRGCAPGRGAYAHRDAACIREAVESGGLARALRAAIQPDEVSNLLKRIEAMEVG
jgi:predicted RNA-binding protein YlxR (DUF448 family)